MQGNFKVVVRKKKKSKNILRRYRPSFESRFLSWKEKQAKIGMGRGWVDGDGPRACLQEDFPETSFGRNTLFCFTSKIMLFLRGEVSKCHSDKSVSLNTGVV